MAQVKERAGGGEERKFPSFPPLPLPPLSFFGIRFISRAAKAENPVPRPRSFFSPKSNRNACYAGYHRAGKKIRRNWEGDSLARCFSFLHLFEPSPKSKHLKQANLLLVNRALCCLFACFRVITYAKNLEMINVVINIAIRNIFFCLFLSFQFKMFIQFPARGSHIPAIHFIYPSKVFWFLELSNWQFNRRLLHVDKRFR